MGRKKGRCYNSGALPVLQVVSSRSAAGKTTVAVAVAQGLAAAGISVRLVRAGFGAAATADAQSFTEYLFASAAGAPLDPAQVAGLAAGAKETVIVELDGGGQPLPQTPALLVVRGKADETDLALAKALGDQLLGTVATGVVGSMVQTIARELTDAGLRPLAIIAEDRSLAGPCVAEIREALGAETIFDGDNELDVVEDILIAPVYADPAQPHFRRFAAKAVLAPFNKTDLLLAAIETEAACLVITGGHQPSPYVPDRAQHGSTTVLLAREETPQTLNALSEVWLTSRFRGLLKAEAAYAHLQGRIDFPGLARKLGG
jgi:BioD-like phosphotransacetylase family protein